MDSLNVVAGWRRRRIGSTLLRLMAEYGAEHGRTHIHGRVRSAIPAGAAFAAAMGGSPGLEERESELDLACLDLEMIDRWIAEGPTNAPGYEVVFMTDGYDRSCLPAIAETYDAMDDMPHDDMQAQTQRKTIEQLVGADAMLAGSGEARWSAFAREVGSDRFAGVTDIFFRSWDPAVVNQGNTGVLRAHRGRRLGWWLKAAMARKIVDEVPEARIIRTGNAFSNAHMLAINDAMGFTVSSVTTTWELPVKTVLDRASGQSVAMRTELVAAAEDDRSIVRRLLELNAHDFSEIDGRDVGPHGEYGYRYLDHYWTEPDRHAFLIKVDGQIAGLVLIRAGDPHEFGEFFVLRKYRRSGIGRAAAHEVFRRFPGSWVVHEIPGNDAAVSFWRTVIPVAFEEAVDASGTSQRFTAL
jgi:predicted acetyltransferase